MAVQTVSEGTWYELRDSSGVALVRVVAVRPYRGSISLGTVEGGNLHSYDGGYFLAHATPKVW
jgi:hypothetical protein